MLKWNILPNQNVLPNTRRTKEEQESHYNMYDLKNESTKEKHLLLKESIPNSLHYTTMKIKAFI